MKTLSQPTHIVCSSVRPHSDQCTASQYSHCLPEKVQQGGFREHRDNIDGALKVILWGKRMQCVPLRVNTVECHRPLRIAISVCTCAFLDTPWRPRGCTTVISVPGRSLSPGCRLDPCARPEPFARPKFGAQCSALSVSHVIVRTRTPSRPSRHETKPTRSHAHAAFVVFLRHLEAYGPKLVIGTHAQRFLATGRSATWPSTSGRASTGRHGIARASARLGIARASARLGGSATCRPRR